MNIRFRVINGHTKDDIHDKSIPRLNVLVGKGSNTPCLLVMQKIHKETFFPT